MLDLYNGDGLAGLALTGLIGNGAGDSLQALGGRERVPNRLGIGGPRPLYRISYEVHHVIAQGRKGVLRGVSVLGGVGAAEVMHHDRRVM